MTQPRQQHSGPQSDAAHSASRWEERYASVEQLWSGRPNDWLPELAADWSPGTALEIGCGEGGATQPSGRYSGGCSPKPWRQPM